MPRFARVAALSLTALTLLLLFQLQQGGLLTASSSVGCTHRSVTFVGSDTTPFPPLAAPAQRGAAASQSRRCTKRSRRSRYILDAASLPIGIPGAPDEPLHVTFATASVDELLRNWAKHLRQLRLPAVVAAMDRWVVERCGDMRVHCLPSTDAKADEAMSAEAAKHGQRDASLINVRGNPTLFISLGARKVGAILTLLHASGRPLVVSDVDVVWMQDPSHLLMGRMPGYEDFAFADVLLSSDCLDPGLDLSDHGCFHVLQDRNTGVLMVRNTTAARGVMIEWQARTGGAFQAWETDQTAFDDMLRGRGRGHRRNMTREQRESWFKMKKEWCGLAPGLSEPETMGTLSELDGKHVDSSRRLFDVCIPLVAKALRFGLLPLAYIANGHSFFVQQLQLQSGVWPYAVHATYQFEDQLDCAFGKRERMREWNIWLVDDAEEEEEDDDDEEEDCSQEPEAAKEVPYAPYRLAIRRPGERFLVLEDDEELAPSVNWDVNDPHARGRQHVAHLDKLRQSIAYGVLVAKALNRTLVLPKLRCYCDKYWSRLTQCTIGAQALKTQPLPFDCPMDHVLPISHWHGSTQTRKKMPRCALPTRADGPPSLGMPYRTNSWLKRAQALEPSLAHPGSTLVPEKQKTTTGRNTPQARTPSSAKEELWRCASLPCGHQGKKPLTMRSHGELNQAQQVMLPMNSSDTTLRNLATGGGVVNASDMNYWGNQPMLTVSLRSVNQLLGCVTKRLEAESLFDSLFRMKWCWRPEEMLEPRVDNKTGETIDVCVWGLKVPLPPPRCIAG